jgi:catechol 2,3-dioxygenase-like lactoylglutathione lyase family enzyme
MKRLHVHAGVKDLDQAIAYYTALFGAEPTVAKPDYAKWMLDDPRVNFAISSRGDGAGLAHLGIQVDSNEELEQVAARLDTADRKLVEDKNALCCYARGDKYWGTDPAGISWELFHTTGEIETFGAPAATPQAEDARASGPGCC